MQEYKIIKSILKDFLIDEGLIDYSEEENSFISPIGIIQCFDDVWHISFDLSFNSSIQSINYLSQFIKELMNHQIMIEIDSPYYIYTTEELNEVYYIWESDIYDLIKQKDNSITYEQAKEMLIENIKKEIEGNTDNKFDKKEVH